MAVKFGAGAYNSVCVFAMKHSHVILNLISLPIDLVVGNVPFSAPIRQLLAIRDKSPSSSCIAVTRYSLFAIFYGSQFVFSS